MTIDDRSTLASHGMASSPSPRAGTVPIARTLSEELDGLYRYSLCRLGGDRHAAEDAVQQIARIALSHDSPPGGADEQRAWLRGVARNVVRRHWRSDVRRCDAMRAAASKGAGTDTGVAMDALESGAIPAIDTPERARLVDRVFHAVTSLCSADQRLFYDYYRAGRSHEWLAAELGTTAKAIESKLYRMRERLRAALAAEMEGDP